MCEALPVESMKPDATKSKMNTIDNIRTEIETIDARLSEITRQLGEFWKENDNGAYSIIWPAWAMRARAEEELLIMDREDAQRRLAKEETREADRADARARAAEKEASEAFEQEKAAVAAADPRAMWSAVNAKRAEAGSPALPKGFIGSAHVKRIALTLGLFEK
jgi:uncharacterized membrane protein YqiK